MAGKHGEVNPLDLATAIGFQFARGPEMRAHLENIKTELARVQEKFTRLFSGEEVDEAALENIIDKPAQNEWVASLLSSVAEMTALFARMHQQVVESVC